MSFAAAATDLRRREIARLKQYVAPPVETMRSLTPGPFRERIAELAHRLGHEVVNDPAAAVLITVKNGEKHLIMCATPSDPAPTGTRDVARLRAPGVSDFVAPGAARSLCPVVTSMEDLEKKLFAQLDDPMPGQRAQALEMLHAHDEKHKSSFRDRLAKIERGEQYDALDREATALRQQNTTLDGELTQYKAAVAQWQKHAAAMQSKLAIASAIAWGRTTGLRLAAYAALPLIALVGWQGYERYWPLPAAVRSGLQEIADNTAWGQGCGQAVVRNVDGQPYWVLPCGRIDTTSHLERF